MKPFTPDEALGAKADVIPTFVIEAVNLLLAKKFNGGQCTIKQNEIIEVSIERWMLRNEPPANLTREMFFANHWLNIEGLYRQHGWKVKYDKPAYNETYDAFFVFERDAEREAEQRFGRRW